MTSWMRSFWSTVGDAVMSRPRNQHQVPRSYLRNFADPLDRVRVYDRIDKVVIPDPVGIRNVASKSNFYSITNGPDDHDDTFETGVLRRVDGDLNAFLPQLLAPQPVFSTSDRVKLDMIMILQFLRTLEGKRFLENTIDFNFRMLIEMYLTGASGAEVEHFIQEHFPGASEPDKVLIRRIASDRTQPLELNQAEWLLAMMNNMDALTNDVVTRPWLLFDSDEAAFLTSDTPVVLIGREPLNLVTADVIAWPISPGRIVLRPNLGSRRRREFQVGHATPDQVRALNQHIADRARRQIIWQPGTDPLAGLVLPEGPPMVRVGTAKAGPDDHVFDVWLDERQRAVDTMAPFIKRRDIRKAALDEAMGKWRRKHQLS